jgi:drug/metabolite transporter (DMT)-like permease
MVRSKTEGHFRPRHPWWSLVRTIAVIVTGFSAFTAFSLLPLAQTYALLFATPLLITILSIAATSLIIFAYRTAEAAVVAPMQYSQIVWATIFGWLVFAEMPDATTLIGAAVVIASGLYILMRESGARRDDNQPVLNTGTRHDTGTFPGVGTLMKDGKAVAPVASTDT